MPAARRVLASKEKKQAAKWAKARSDEIDLQFEEDLKVLQRRVNVTVLLIAGVSSYILPRIPWLFNYGMFG